MEFDTNLPIYIQIIRQIKKELIKGNLKLGEKMLSGRDLALKYQINPNTAGRIYKELELDGICYTKRGLGTFVTEDKRKLEEIKTEMAERLLKEFIYGMKDIGFTKQEIIDLLNSKF